MPTGRIKDFAGILFVLLSGLVLIYRITQRVDIMATDDDVYFRNGLIATWHHLPPIQMAPLFSVWYLLIHAVTGDVINTYYVSCALLSVLPGLLFYGLLRSLNASPLVSALVAICFLFSQLNLPLQPKVSVFTMLWLMGGLIVTNRQIDPVRKLTAAAAGALLAAYGRPEFFLSFLLLGGVALTYYGWVRRRRRMPVPYPLLGLLGVAVLLVGVFGSPLAGGRSVIAFGQHFALNYAVWHPEIPFSPWMHSGTFIRHGFGRDVTSLSDAFLLNPTLFARHLSANLVNLITHTGSALVNILVDPWLTWLVFPGRRYLLLAIAVAVAGGINWPQTGRNLRQSIGQHGWYWLCVLAILAPTYISCILIYPRAHYIIFQMMLYLSVTGLLLSACAVRPLPAVPWAVGYGVAGLLLVLFLLPRWRANSQPAPTPIADLFRALQRMPLHGAISMTGNVPLMYNLYLGENWEFWYLGRYQPVSLQRFVEQFKINCIHVQPDMAETYKKDPFFARLIANPAALDFARYDTGKPGQYVLVRNKLLPVAYTPHPH